MNIRAAILISVVLTGALAVAACGGKETPPPATTQPPAETAAPPEAKADAAPTEKEADAAPTPTKTSNADAVKALEALIGRAGGSERDAYLELAGGERGVLQIDEGVCEARIRIAGDIARFACKDDLSQCAALQESFGWTFLFEPSPDGGRRLLGVWYADAADAPTWLTEAQITQAKAARDAKCRLVDEMLTDPGSLVARGVWTFDADASKAEDVAAKCGEDAAEEIEGWVEDPSCLACDGLICESAPGCSGRFSSWMMAVEGDDDALHIRALGTISLEKEETSLPDFVRTKVAEEPKCPE